MKKFSTRARLRLGVVGIVAAVGATGMTVGASAEPSPNRSNRLEATFAETRVSLLDRAADLGIRQVITSGTGSLEGYGAASELAAISQDHAVTPCGTGSSSSTILRRIVVPEGTLVIKTLAHRCPAGGGVIIATGEYLVDGASSTGVFAGARGKGTETVHIEPPPSGAITATISGKLHLVRGSDD